MCNVVYKLVSKTLANRLKLILPRIILESQSAFIKGRLISDNVLIAYELIHAIKNRRVHKKGYFALKLDMSKAYDRVEWQYLMAIMSKLGFSERWTQLLYQCISLVSYSIMINGSLGIPFVPQRKGSSLPIPLCAMC